MQVFGHQFEYYVFNMKSLHKFCFGSSNRILKPHSAASRKRFGGISGKLYVPGISCCCGSWRTPVCTNTQQLCALLLRKEVTALPDLLAQLVLNHTHFFLTQRILMKLGQSVTAHTAMLANLNQLQCCRQECHAYMSACSRCAGLAVRTESPAQPCQLSLGLQQVAGAGQCLRAPSHSSVNVNWNLLEESSRVKNETTGLFCSLLLFCAPGALYLEQSPAFSGAPEQLLPVSVACAVVSCNSQCLGGFCSKTQQSSFLRPLFAIRLDKPGEECILLLTAFCTNVPFHTVIQVVSDIHTCMFYKVKCVFNLHSFVSCLCLDLG